MISALSKLTQEEIDLMKKTPALVTILIAGADKKIEQSELREAVALAKLKQSRSREILKEYYGEVSVQFEGTLNDLIGSMPSDPEKRAKVVVEELEKLNTILPKLEKSFAAQFYASMKDFSRKVAEASGGVFGYLSVSYEEAKLMELKMIKDPS